MNKTQYSFSSRFEEGVGTNPVELIAAAHARCLTMKLAFKLKATGFTPDELTTNCKITLDNGEPACQERDFLYQYYNHIIFGHSNLSAEA